MAKFKARARALDMLGRQQIAGIPTAISELFKNAHDAYAKRVEVDFYRQPRLFVLRDNGFGMSKEEFLERWLTLGTESKMGGKSGLGQPPPPDGEVERPLMGEKGIGRLAIAAIGSQVLVLSRARRGRKLHDLVAAFIPWKLFELPGVNLDEIDIPVKTFEGAGLPTKADVDALVDEARRSIRTLIPRLDPAKAGEILSDLQGFDVDPERIERVLNGADQAPDERDVLSLSGGNTGTHFIIQPASETLLLDIDTAGGRGDASNLKRTLIGFSNTMTRGAPEPRVRTEFRLRADDQSSIELIGPSEFFGKEDYSSADHTIAGRFDELGNFKGKLRIFERDEIEYSLPCALKGRAPACGPFSIDIGYVQGAARESLLYSKDPEAFAKLTRRLDDVGGIYVYRDGIRILPYGDQDFDFLRIEERRNKGAAYYFFSYRRMFGAILLTRKENSQLEEKAGREGFRQNRAYHDLRDLMISLLVNLAGEFFRESASRADIFQKQKEELERNELLRRERKRQVRTQIAALSALLELFHAKIESGQVLQEAKEFADTVARNLAAAKMVNVPELAASEVIRVEKDSLRQLDEFRRKYRIAKPRGIALSKQIRREWESYLSEAETLEQNVFAPLRLKIDELAAQAAQSASVAVDRRKRAERALEDEITKARKSIRPLATETQKSAELIALQVGEICKNSLVETEEVIAKALEHLATLNLSELTDAQFGRERIKLEHAISGVAERRRDLLGRLKEMLESTAKSLSPGGKGTSPDELTEALEEELLALREREIADLELTQLGMAIEVINHEFGASIRAVRSALRRLKPWGDANPKLMKIYKELQVSFEHLDAYLGLFTPLHRRLYRQKVSIAGSDIREYIEGLFGDRLKRHEIALISTKAFLEHKFEGYPSTLFPVFVNLVDNSVFWLEGRPAPRSIAFDFDGQAMIVSDTGPGIPKRDRDAIFEAGFSRKPAGRGLGLYISREVLRKAGYRLELGESVSKEGAKFRIEPDLGSKEE